VVRRDRSGKIKHGTGPCTPNAEADASAYSAGSNANADADAPTAAVKWELIILYTIK
jgi:hypothetical protein